MCGAVIIVAFIIFEVGEQFECTHRRHWLLLVCGYKQQPPPPFIQTIIVKTNVAGHNWKHVASQIDSYIFSKLRIIYFNV